MSDVGQSVQLVTFELGEELYGINIMDVNEIVQLQEVRAIPSAPLYVEGIINLRGAITPIISLHRRFNIQRAGSSQEASLLSGFLILDVQGMQLGVLIDKVSRVVTIDMAEIREPPQILSGIGKEYIEGVTSDTSGYLIILDINRLFDPRELQQLGQLSG
ncbi:MAG: chemotaxis protein CheW [Spirochaetales bacterium]|jgi:purine-binding chemotaxis protein CheW|nr:chemotaxis protein CheW [Spirochaetales bacterium]